MRLIGMAQAGSAHIVLARFRLFILIFQTLRLVQILATLSAIKAMARDFFHKRLCVRADWKLACPESIDSGKTFHWT
jgi:hypothetical protein